MDESKFYLFEVVGHLGNRGRWDRTQEGCGDQKSVAVTAETSMQAVLKAAKWFSERDMNVSRISANILCTSSAALISEVEEIVAC